MSHRTKRIHWLQSLASSLFPRRYSQTSLPHRRVRIEHLESRAMLDSDGLTPEMQFVGLSSLSEGSDYLLQIRVNEDPDSTTPVGAQVTVDIDLNGDSTFEYLDQVATVADLDDNNPPLLEISIPWSALVAALIDDGPNATNGSGNYPIVAVLDDIDDDFGMANTSIVVDNVIPLIQSFTVNPEGCGSSVELIGTLIEVNPDESGLAVYVDWDYDSDAEFFPSEDDELTLTIGDGLTHVSGNMYAIEASHTYALPGTYTVVLRATADPEPIFDFPGFHGSYEETFFDVDNTANESNDVVVTGVGGSLSAAILEPSTASVPGETRQFTADVVLGCGTPGTLTYDWSVTKDGSLFASSTNAAFVFTPDDEGEYVVSLSVEDDAETADAVDVTFDVEPFIFESGNLAVGSGLGNDTITLSPGSVIVNINGVPVGEFNATSVTVYGGDGDDTITVNAGITIPITIVAGSGNDVIKGGSGPEYVYGGDGNDHLKGGDGADILIGDAGQDFLAGGAGRDILIGGDEADKIHGNDQDDIIISGIVSFSSDLNALVEIRAVWLSGNCFAVRTATIEGCLPSLLTHHLNWTTVTDDNDKDILAGDQGTDWFFANLWLNGDEETKDKILDVSLFELCFANDLDL